MCRQNHGSHDHDHHHHHTSHEESSPLPRKERLIIRLEHHVQHNNEHAAFYTNLANEAMGLGGEEAARLIRAAAAFTAQQNEHLEKALSVLKSVE